MKLYTIKPKVLMNKQVFGMLKSCHDPGEMKNQ